jgi:hypothetical protein
MPLDAAIRADAPPPADNASVPEQCFLDGQRVEAGHVPARIPAFDIKVILLRDHAEQNRAARFRRPMIGLNHRTRIDSFW